MSRKLDSETFIDPTSVPAFVNQQHIEQEDIQFITKDREGNTVLLYWRIV